MNNKKQHTGMKVGFLGGLHNAVFQEFDTLVGIHKVRARQKTNTWRIDHFPVAGESATASGPNM